MNTEACGYSLRPVFMDSGLRRNDGKDATSPHPHRLADVASLDLHAGRPREAALQARIALEAALAELGGRAAELDGDRAAVADAANAALDGDPAPELQAAVAAAVEHMERALRRRRAGG